MDKRSFELVVIAIVLVPTAALVYSAFKGVQYLVGLRKCALWAATLVVLSLVNNAIADHVFSGELRAAKQSSGYVHGRGVISPYGFLFQILLIIEIVCIVLVKKWLSKVHGK